MNPQIIKYYSQGFGNMSTNRKDEPSGAPFPVGAANSGLHVDIVTGVIQLGSDGGLDPLLQATDIELAGFELFATNAGARVFSLNPTTGQYAIGDINNAANRSFFLVDDPNRRFTMRSDVGGHRYLDLNGSTGQYMIGDVGLFGNRYMLQIDDAGQTVSLGDFNGVNSLLSMNVTDLFFSGSGGNWLTLQPSIDLYQIGDISSVTNGIILQVDDAAQTTTMGDVLAGLNFFQVDSSSPAGLRLLGQGNLGNPILDLDQPNALYRIGDMNAGNNGSVLTVDDNNRALIFNDSLGEYLRADATNGRFAFGDIQNTVNNSYLEISDPAQQLRFYSLAGGLFNYYFELNTLLGVYQMGDIWNNFNGSFIDIQDTSQTFNFFSGAGGASSYLALDVANGIFQIGDINGATNGTSLQISDTTRNIVMGDVLGLNNLTTLTVDDILQIVSVAAVNGLLVTGDTTVIHTGTAWADGAAAQVGTLLNAPTAGNPTKWIPFDDNGTTRFVPAW